LHAESISGIRFAIRVILGELWAVEVVKTTSAGSSICPVDKIANGPSLLDSTQKELSNETLMKINGVISAEL